MRTEKGQPGYVKARKQKYLLGAVVEFAIVIAIFVTGYIQTGSRLNLLTVVAVVGFFAFRNTMKNFLIYIDSLGDSLCSYQLIDIFNGKKENTLLK